MTSVTTINAAKNNTFQDYYENVLIPKYGKFKRSQTGIMHSWEDEWLKVTGVMGVTVKDYDLDGKNEMLVIVAKPIDNKTSKIVMQMYEIVNGEVSMSSQIRFKPYYTKDYASSGVIALSTNEWVNAFYLISTVKSKNNIYLVCEEQDIAGAFADGVSHNYWVMRYKDNKFQYVVSFTQTEGGSSGFEYTGYSFKNGKLSKSELLYAETWKKGKYDSYKTALEKIFGQSNIKLAGNISENEDRYKSIISTSSKPDKIFQYRNKLVSGNYTSSTYKFKTSIFSKDTF